VAAERAARSPRRLRVLHVVQNLNYGGMERLLFEMLRLSDRTRFESHVLNLQFVGRFGQGLEEFAGVHLAPPMSRLSMLRPRALASAIADLAPDVVHTHSGVWYKASLAARIAGVPWLLHTEHGRAIPDPWLSRTLDRFASARTDVIVGVSEAVAAQLRDGVVAHSERVVVVPNGVDVDRFAPTRDVRLVRELGIPGEAPILGSIGRLEPIKGYEVMVDAFAHLQRGWNGGSRPFLIVAGDGSERSALEARTRAAGVQGNVRWLGWRDDVSNLYAAFTLFTMSSHSEGTSISLLEAMSSELCPVVTEVGGNRAVLGEGLRHRLVPPADPAALADAWRAALADRQRRAEDARAARRRVSDAFSLQSMVDRYERLYRREGLPSRDSR
jgi:glycosyltransferase involved in cell wall biosynthesis